VAPTIPLMRIVTMHRVLQEVRTLLTGKLRTASAGPMRSSIICWLIRAIAPPITLCLAWALPTLKAAFTVDRIQNVPQQTFQTDKQLRYDGSWTRGRQTFRFGASLNRILGGGLAAFFGYGPQVAIDPSTVIGDPSEFRSMAIRPFSIRISNDQGYASEKPGFGLPAGFQGDWRTGFYISDSIKVSPSFTLTIAARYDRDTGRTNSDLAPFLVHLLTLPTLILARVAHRAQVTLSCWIYWGAGLAAECSSLTATLVRRSVSLITRPSRRRRFFVAAWVFT